MMVGATLPSEARADLGCPGSYDAKPCGGICGVNPTTGVGICRLDLFGGTADAELHAYRDPIYYPVVHAWGRDSNGQDFCCAMNNVGTNCGAATYSFVAMGGQGNDVIDLAPTVGGTPQFMGGMDTLIAGGPGDDTIYGNNAVTCSDHISGNAGADTIFGNAGPDRIFGHAEGGGGPADDGAADTLVGGTEDDVIYGGDGDDVILGGAGDDVLWGEGGDDDIMGGDEADVIYGGAGNDEICGEGGGDMIEGGAGDDWIYASPAGTGTDWIDGGDDYDYCEAVFGAVDCEDLLATCPL